MDNEVTKFISFVPMTVCLLRIQQVFKMTAMYFEADRSVHTAVKMPTLVQVQSVLQPRRPTWIQFVIVQNNSNIQS